MLDFFKNHWDECLSVLAIIVAVIPAVIKWINAKRRKISANIVDYRIIKNAQVSDCADSKRQKGTILLLAVNLFIPIESFFVEKYEITANLKSGTTSNAIIIDGTLTIHDNEKDVDLSIPSNYNFNLHKEIICEKDNIRIFELMFVDASFEKIDNLDNIFFKFKNSKSTKTITIKTESFPEFNKMKFLSDFEKDITIF